MKFGNQITIVRRSGEKTDVRTMEEAMIIIKWEVLLRRAVEILITSVKGGIDEVAEQLVKSI